MGGQIVDATLIASRGPRLTQVEKDTIKGGGVPSAWMPARRAQIDCYGRWTIKRGKQREAGPGDGHQRQVEIAVPVFGYKNHIGIDRAFGFLRGYTVAHAFNVENRVTRIPLRTRFQRCDQSGDRSDAGCCERSRAPPGCLRVVDVW